MTSLPTHRPQEDAWYQDGDGGTEAVEGGEASEETDGRAGFGKWLSKSERRAAELKKQSKSRYQVRLASTQSLNII